MNGKTIHYRVRDLGGQIVAHGCGASGKSGSTRTPCWDDVTCGGCKRSKEWKEASAENVDTRFGQTIKTLGEPVTISVGKTSSDETGSDDGHGYYDPTTGAIVIGDHVPDPLRHVVFMHEVLHLVDLQLKGMGITKRCIPHEWIINASPLLVAFLIESGFWRNGPTLRELDKAMRASAPRPLPSEESKP
jgi:hypothetical protein